MLGFNRELVMRLTKNGSYIMPFFDKHGDHIEDLIFSPKDRFPKKYSLPVKYAMNVENWPTAFIVKPDTALINTMEFTCHEFYAMRETGPMHTTLAYLEDGIHENSIYLVASRLEKYLTTGTFCGPPMKEMIIKLPKRRFGILPRSKRIAELLGYK